MNAAPLPAARQFSARLANRRSLGQGGFVLELEGCGALRGAQPGQFVMLRPDWGRDPLLPRAFSILGLEAEADGRCDILVKAVGRGTRLLDGLSVGTPVALTGPLGKPFATPDPETKDLLVAGGVGLAPLLWYARVAARAGIAVELFYGARSAADLVLLDEIAATQAELSIATEDGTAGAHGRVTRPFGDRLQRGQNGKSIRVLTCGPNPMMRAVAELAATHQVPCYVSVEGEMACGIGACLGCAVPTPRASRPFAYACVDGPVFDARAIVIPVPLSVP